MKNQFKYYFLTLIVAFAFIGCSDEVLELNEDPNNPTSVPAANLITQAEYNLYDRLHSRVVNAEWGMLMVQHWAQNEYTQEQRYQGIDGGFFDATFVDIYTNTLNELKSAKEITANSTLDDASKANINAVIDILMADAYMALTDGFGAIPYTEALNSVEFPNPSYDSQASIYENILMSLDNAINAISTSGTVDGDVIYDGDMAKWKKFGASLMLQAAMRVSDSDSGMASSYANDAVSYGVFESNADNAIFEFSSDPSLANPLYVDNSLNNRDDFCVSEILVETLKDMDDPRLMEYAALNQFDEYKGMPYGLEDGPAFALKAESSRPSDRVREATAPHAILTYSEVQFFIAEAIERNFISGDAESAFDDAVTASMNYWGITDGGAIDDYLDDNSYDSSNWDESIGWQKWLALYMNGHEAWAEWRRLGHPELPVPSAAALNMIPVSWPYPQSEQSRNASALAEVTTDPNSLTDPVWWDE